MDLAHESLPDFSIEQALELLKIHSFTFHDVHDSRMRTGFLGSLRPYQGELNHQAFHEVMACIKAVGPEFSQGETVDREALLSLWSICQLARVWAVTPTGMLRSNQLIRDVDVAVMDDWIDCISYAVMCLLECANLSEAFAPYDRYVKEKNSAAD